MYQLMGVFAEFERSIIQERVRAGLKRAVSEGQTLGRSPIAPELEKRIHAALKVPGRKEGVRKIAARFGVAVGTVQRISRPFEGCIESVSEGGYRRRVNELQKRITRSVPSVSRPSGDLAQQALISRVAGHVYGASLPRPPLGVGSQK